MYFVGKATRPTITVPYFIHFCQWFVARICAVLYGYFIRNNRIQAGGRDRWDVYLIETQNNEKRLHHFLVLREGLTNHCSQIELTTPGKLLDFSVGRAKANFLYTELTEPNSELTQNAYKETITIIKDQIYRISRDIVENEFNGEYSLTERNSQEFCNKFLPRVGLLGYKSTSQAFRDYLTETLRNLFGHGEIKKLDNGKQY